MKNVDSTLLARLGAGDEQAFQYLYASYKGMVFMIAYKMLHDGEMAKDTVQDVFMRVWRRRDAFAKADSFTNMVAFTTRRMALNKIEKEEVERRRRDGYLRTNDRIYLIHDYTSLGDKLKMCLDKMTDIELDVFRFLKIDGGHYATVAWRLGITLNTVKFHAKNMMKKLRPLGTSYQIKNTSLLK